MTRRVLNSSGLPRDAQAAPSPRCRFGPIQQRDRPEPPSCDDVTWPPRATAGAAHHPPGEEWLAWTVVAAPVPLRALTVGVTEAGVVLVCFGAGTGAVRAQLAEAGRRLDVAPVEDAERAGPIAAELADYLAGRTKTFDAPIDWRLTHGDQQVVLRTLYDEVGYGDTITYGELAVRSGAYATERGAGQAARRVGAIMGSNPVPVIVPCHRVLAANGLGGFGGGLESKRWLLDLEGALPPMLDLW